MLLHPAKYSKRKAAAHRKKLHAVIWYLVRVTSFQIYPLGDQALTLQLGDAITEEVNEQCIALAHYLDGLHIPGVKEVAAAYHTVTIRYDAFAIHQHAHSPSPAEWLRQHLMQRVQDITTIPATSHRLMEVPACFDLSFAPDLEMLAAQKQMTTDAVVHAFTSTRYRVYMIGFLPGFPYMALVPQSIATPRKQQPSLIQPGSIGIAGVQTGIYPLQSPGGWNIIGRTPWRIFDAMADTPNLFQAGDTVKFYPIDIETFHQQNQHL